MLSSDQILIIIGDIAFAITRIVIGVAYLWVPFYAAKRQTLSGLNRRFWWLWSFGISINFFADLRSLPWFAGLIMLAVSGYVLFHVFRLARLQPEPVKS